MEQKVSIKNTKNQIMDAYNELLQKIQSQKSEEPKQIKKQLEKQELTDKAKSLSNEGIVKNIAHLKINISSELDKLGEHFISEYKKFEELQHAIKTEKKNLEDLYQLSANTDSLAVMLLAHKEQKEQFEQEMSRQKSELEAYITSEKENFEQLMSEKRKIWKKEQDEQAIKNKEAEELIKKNRQREEEEYIYNLKISRKKNEDLYAEKSLKLEKELIDRKAEFEKEFSERQTKIEEAEAELIELRKKNTAFPAELEKAKEEAVKKTAKTLNTEHNFTTELNSKEVEGILKLKDQTIETLHDKIKEMEIAMKEMSQKTAKAETSVKDIALKAIESSSKPYFIEKEKDNNLSQK